MKFYISIKTCIVLGLLLSVVACSDKREEQIIARVNDKTISLNEFIRRAEYTVRPNYCKNNTSLEKKIILNSLIAEKIFAIEAGKENEILNKETVKNFLQGRKEQAMRQLLYKEEVIDKLELDESLIQKVSNFVTREYDVSYVSVTDTFVVSQLKEEFIDLNLDWDKTLHENYNLEKIPQRIVTWNGVENYKILDLLFTQEVKKGSVYGPIKFSDNHYMFLKVNGWKSTKEITESQKLLNIKNIRDVYTTRESKTQYESYIQKVMKDHNIEFNSEIFFNLADIFGPIYMKSLKEKEEIFKNGVWAFDKEQRRFYDTKPNLDKIANKALYKLDGETFTVSQFINEIKTHPLVFRKKEFPQNEFGFQLQMAIVDQVRDRYLTKIAYENSLDQSLEVTRDNGMWSDYISSISHKYNYLKTLNSDSLFSEDNQVVINEVLNPYVDKLQKEYSDQIYINTDLLNSIKLSSIDMSVIYSGSPFSLVVPSFPLITTDYQLEYGSVNNNLN